MMILNILNVPKHISYPGKVHERNVNRDLTCLLFLIHIWSRLPCELVIALINSWAAVWAPSPTGCKSWFGQIEAVTLRWVLAKAEVG